METPTLFNIIWSWVPLKNFCQTVGKDVIWVFNNINKIIRVEELPSKDFSIQTVKSTTHSIILLND